VGAGDEDRSGIGASHEEHRAENNFDLTAAKGKEGSWMPTQRKQAGHNEENVEWVIAVEEIENEVVESELMMAIVAVDVEMG